VTHGTAQAAGPVPEHFEGDGLSSAARRIFHATRPKFFPASVLPILAGSAWGASVSAAFDGISFLLALVAVVLVHAGSNVINDVSDDAGGTDRQNDDRIYPYTGGSRFIQAGIIDSTGMIRLGTALLAFAALAGLLLLYLKGPMILAFGLAGILLGVFYSVGPLRLASLGLGELAVAVAFGTLPVVGAGWLQSGVVDSGAMIFSLPVSAWVGAILLINEVPDIAADAATGKRTLPVRLGVRRTALLYAAVQLAGFTAVAGMSASGLLPAAAILVPLVLVWPAMKVAAAIRRGGPDRAGMTRAIESTLAIHATGTAWLAICVLAEALLKG